MRNWQKSFMHIFHKQAEEASFRSYLVGSSIGVFVLQVVSTGLGFITNILLTRFLGVTEYGIYSYIIAWTGLLTVLAMFGYGNMLVREVATYREKKDWHSISGLLIWVATSSFLIALTISLFIGFLLWLFQERMDSALFPAVWFALLVIPFATLFNLAGFAMRGIRQAVLGLVASVFVRLPLFIIFLLIAYNFFSPELTASTAIRLSLFALILGLCAATGLLWRSLPLAVKRATSHYQWRVWINQSLPLLLVAGLHELNSRIPILMLGSLSSIETTGFYSVSMRITTLIIFVLNAVNITLSPIISSLYASGEMRRLQRIITTSTRVTLIITLFIVAVIILSRDHLLAFFGNAFQQAGILLIILSIGQLINAAAGSVGLILIMTGHEKKVLFAIGASTLVAITLNILVIPRWGINGAGLSTVISLITWNIILIAQVYKQLGIDPTFFGAMSKWKTA